MDRITAALLVVVLPEPAAKPACLYPHGSIDRRIVIMSSGAKTSIAIENSFSGAGASVRDRFTTYRRKAWLRCAAANTFELRIRSSSSSISGVVGLAPVVPHENAPGHPLEPIGLTHVNSPARCFLSIAVLMLISAPGRPKAFPRKEVRVAETSELAASLCLAISAASIASCCRLIPSFRPMQPSTPPNSKPPAASNSAPAAISTSPKQGQAEPSQLSAPAPSVPAPNRRPISAAAPDASRNWTSPANAPQSPSGFPSTVDAVGDLQGVADIALALGSLYAVTAAGGCSHGNASSPNIIARVDIKSGSWKAMANLSQFLQSHPAAYPNAADFEPDGVFYSLIALDNRLYTRTDPAMVQLFSSSASGDLREELDISMQQGHIVPTSVAVNNGKFYIGNLGLFPITPDSSTGQRAPTPAHAPGPSSSVSAAATSSRSLPLWIARRLHHSCRRRFRP